MDIIDIDIRYVELNRGQIDGVPPNPREITEADINKMAISLKQTPELFALRPCIVYPVGDKYVLLGGNLRYLGAKRNKTRFIPCEVVDASTSADKLKEIVIKDNGVFGAWDYDQLANEWGDLPLVDWGVAVWEESAEEEAQDTKEEETETHALKLTFCNAEDMERFVSIYGDTLKTDFSADVKRI